MPSTSLLKRDWEKDHVYLVQFPRIAFLPTPSPYALKLETFLRMADIPYTNVSNEFSKMSSRGQIPFIELNGRQHADSGLIIESLIPHFHKEQFESLPAEEKAVARAFHSLIEHHLAYTIFQSRSQCFDWIATEKGFSAHLSGLKAFGFKKIMLGQLQKKIKARCIGQGIGRMTKDEVVSDYKKNIDAISTQLGGKDYLFGSEPKVIDATAFGFLAQFLYTPLYIDELKTYLEGSTPNLVSYVNRIKEKYWPDWDEISTTLALNTNYKK